MSMQLIGQRPTLIPMIVLHFHRHNYTFSSADAAAAADDDDDDDVGEELVVSRQSSTELHLFYIPTSSSA